jgi:hypothetical protein
MPRDNPVVGLGGLEPPTSPLSGVRSNHLSYRPALPQGQRLHAPLGLSRPSFTIRQLVWTLAPVALTAQRLRR